MFSCNARALALAVLGFASAALAIPNYGGMARSNGGMAGLTEIEALGPTHYGARSTENGAARYFLTTNSPLGTEGHALIRPNHEAPKFFISPVDSQLYQLINGTTIFHVNLHNITENSVVSPDRAESPLQLDFGTKQAPLRMVIEPKKSGLTNGRWRWQGPMLYYETTTNVMKNGHVQGSNLGLFYQCYDKWGIPGVYLSLTPIPTPGGCVIITLHSSTVSGADY